ncbi:MAG: UDP-3-O-(3-hydroxymyristoyl)glucosamine N-acyltransferase [Verrucomicrobiia bacterium]
MQNTVLELAKLVEATLEGDGSRLIAGVGGLDDATSDQLSFLANPKYKRSAQKSRAGAILLGLKEPPPNDQASLLRVENPSKAFAEICALYFPIRPKPKAELHPQAIISPQAKLAANVTIQAGAVIEENVEIGEGTVIGANVYLGRDVKIGKNSLIHPNVTILERCQIGDEVVIHSGAVIGADGFGFDLSQGGAEKIPQVGMVQIDNRVEIGANTTIDRARFGKTWIQEGVKIDNLVQIAHNVVVGKHTIIVAQVGISGSTTLGQQVIIAGQVGMAGHIHIGDGAVVTAQAGVSKDVAAKSIVSGYHAQPIREEQRIEAAMRRLPELLKRVKELEALVAQLQKKK